MESSIVIGAKAGVSEQAGVAPVDGSREENSFTEQKATLAEALNKAKEAFSLDRTLHRFRDQHGENIFHNFDLTYAVSYRFSFLML